MKKDKKTFISIILINIKHGKIDFKVFLSITGDLL